VKNPDFMKGGKYFFYLSPKGLKSRKKIFFLTLQERPKQYLEGIKGGGLLSGLIMDM
jgi:hypothetical protein